MTPRIVNVQGVKTPPKVPNNLDGCELRDPFKCRSQLKSATGTPEIECRILSFVLESGTTSA